MAYCAIGIQKLKTKGAITGSGNHTDRIWHPDNADKNRTQHNIEIFDTQGKELLDLVETRIDQAWKRSEAVLLAELRLVASPEYFRPDDPKAYGEYNTDKLNSWIDANKAFLEQHFGDKCVKATVHLDEATPHIHAYIIPEMPYHRNSAKYPTSLSFAKIFGNKKYDFRDWQDKYAEAMQHLGLERGHAGKAIPHQKQAQFYRDFLSFIEDEETYQIERDIDEISAEFHQLAIDQDRAGLERDRAELERDREKFNRDRAELDALQRDRDRLKAEIEKLQRDRENADRLHWARLILQAHARMLQSTRKGKKLNLEKYKFTKNENGDRILLIQTADQIIPKNITRADADYFLSLEKSRQSQQMSR